MFLMKHEDDLNTLKTIVKAMILLLIPLAMVASQPDLKNTITIAIIFCILMYAAGLSYKIIGSILLVAVPLVLLGLFLITQTDLPIIDDYQKDRIMTFLNPMMKNIRSPPCSRTIPLPLSAAAGSQARA